MAPGSIRERVADYYSEKIRKFGETAQGVDWNSAESQKLRFEQLLKIVPPSATRYSILDYGCGYGALIDSLADRGMPFQYIGYDVSEEMILRARRLHERDDCTFSNDPEELGAVAYAVASGVFNVKLEIPVADWREYVVGALEDLHRLSTKGFAFNALTSYSDTERMRDDLFYADPAQLFDYCKRTFSGQVALLHDYGLYEFTILVRKNL